MVFPEFGSDPFNTPQSRRNFIKYNISENDWRTRSGNSILEDLSDAGVGIRRQDFFALRRERLAEFERKDQLAEVGQEQLIPYSLMNEVDDIQMTMTAQYRFRMTVRDPETGELGYVYRAVSSDEHWTRGTAEDFASTLFAMGGEGYSFDIVETELHDVWLTPGGRLYG